MSIKQRIPTADNRTMRGKRLREKADRIRRSVVDVAVKNGAGHIAPSLSTVDILTALYYAVMHIEFPGDANRDRLVFSKAHGCYALYAILADRGFISKTDWLNFYRGSFLKGCAEYSPVYGVEAGCGSLGHGLPMAAGIAFGAYLQDRTYRVYCIVGDGELQEGSNWEAIQFAVKHRLSRLTIIVDHNRLQAMDFLDNILTVKDREDDLERKLTAFGCKTVSCEGHDAEKVADVLSTLEENPDPGVPQAIIAKTVKGYGLKCMENVPRFHFRLPTKDELLLGNRYE